MLCALKIGFGGNERNEKRWWEIVYCTQQYRQERRINSKSYSKTIDTTTIDWKLVGRALIVRFSQSLLLPCSDSWLRTLSVFLFQILYGCKDFSPVHTSFLHLNGVEEVPSLLLMYWSCLVDCGPATMNAQWCFEFSWPLLQSNATCSHIPMREFWDQNDLSHGSIRFLGGNFVATQKLLTRPKFSFFGHGRRFWCVLMDFDVLFILMCLSIQNRQSKPQGLHSAHYNSGSN